MLYANLQGVIFPCSCEYSTPDIKVRQRLAGSQPTVMQAMQAALVYVQGVLTDTLN